MNPQEKRERPRARMKKKRTVAVVTVGRSDYGIYLPILRAIRAEPSLRLQLIAGGSHFSKAHGLTAEHIRRDGFTVQARVPLLPAQDSAWGVADAIGRGVRAFASVFSKQRPDVLVLLGDRFEMLAAAVAAAPLGLPIAHLHGGETTEGAMDEVFRHAITKMSHLHFTATEEYRRRVIQLGEEPWRVIVSGAPALDHLKGFQALSRTELERELGMALDPPPILVTWHPVTREPERGEQSFRDLLSALRRLAHPVVFTLPNTDMGSGMIVRELKRFVREQAQARLVSALGTHRYFSLMKVAGAMAGNSSSGIIEAASFKLPVVNIGARQRGRTRGANVLDVKGGEPAILAALRTALSPAFRQKLARLVNPYGKGGSARKVVSVLKRIPLDARLVQKRFHNVQRGGK